MSEKPNNGEPRKKLTLDELRATSEYQRLTQKQQLFVAAYCEGGLLDGNYNPVEATRIAYECKSVNVARTLSYAVMSSIRVIAALNRHFNIEPLDEFLAQIDRAVANRKITAAQIEALRLKSAILGYTGRSASTKASPLGITPKGVTPAPYVPKKRGRPPLPKPAPKPEEPSPYIF